MKTIDILSNSEGSSDYQIINEQLSTTTEETIVATTTEEEKVRENISNSFPNQETLIATTTATSTLIAVEYETPAPVIAEAVTDTGKIVTISATNTSEIPITNVLAFTNIPEIYNVGQEDKIKIKWTNNNDQEVTFHAYDLNNNGKLDYVEWTVPHLSTQTFEIIFISKAFQLDANKEIIADIYDTVKKQDNNYAPILDGQYVRVTFNKILTNKNDITIYAKPASSTPVTIEAYNTNTNQLVATFDIDHEGLYKQLIPELDNPTDVFDLKTIGEVKIDYIVDPADITTGLIAHYLMNETSGTTITDTTGVNNASASNDISTLTTSGKLNSALDFRTTAQYATIPYTSDFNLSSGPFSIATWIYVDPSLGDSHSIINQNNSDGWSLYINGPQQINFYNNSVDIPGSTAISTADWYHVVVTYDGSGNYVFYLDSVAESKSYYDAPTNNSGNLTIGYESRLGPTSRGILDDLRIYNRVLSQEDVDALWNSGGGTEIPIGEGGGDTTAPVITVTSPTNSSVYNTTSVVFNVSATDETSLVNIITNFDSSIVAWWRMDDINGDGTLKDYVNNNSGTIYGSTQVTGKFGKAMSFDGSQEIKMSSSNSMNSNQLTLSAWVKPSTLSQKPWAKIIEKDYSGGAYPYISYSLEHYGADGVFGGEISTSNGETDTLTPIFGSTHFEVDTWYHVVETWDGSYMRLYVNGVEDSSPVEKTGTLTFNSSDFRIGSNRGDSYIEGWTGLIDDTMILNRALTADEVKSLYDGTSINHTSTLAEGSHTYNIYAQDLAGNIASSTNTFNVSLDNTAPTITVTSPVDSTTYSTSSISINISATDANLGNIISNLDNSLISWWRMDDTTNSGTTLVDYMGHNDGTISGATQLTGKFGKAMGFDGNSTYVNIGNPESLQLQHFTALAWVKSTNNGYQFALAHGPSGSSGWGLNFDDTKIYFDDGWVATVLEYSANVHDGAWHQLGIYRDDNNDTGLILDGQVVATGNYAGTFGFSDLFIGARAGGNIIDGSLDDIMIFNRTLTTDEITSLYNGTSINHISTLIDGPHTYKAYAQDTAGNIASTTSTFNVSVDTVAPGISYLYGTPSNNSIQNSTSANVIASTTDNKGQHSVFTDWNDSLISWYRMDDVNGSTLTDYMGNNNGTIYGASQTTGKFGKGLSFDSSTDEYVSLGSDLGLNGTNKMTFSVWIKPNIKSQWQGIFTKKVDDDNDFAIDIVDHDIYGVFGSSFKTIATVSDGVWQHLVVTIDGTYIKTYLNNTLVDTWNNPITFNVSDFLIGKDRGIVGRSLDGSLDDVMIFNRALSADEIKSLYNGTVLNYNTTLTEGSHTYKAYAQDTAGNIASTTSTFTINTDTTAPTTSDNYSSKNNIWQNSNQTITLTPTDDKSSIAWTKYCIDTNNTCDVSSGTSYSNSVTISNEGIYYFRYASLDSSNNLQNTVSRIVKIDKTNPVIDSQPDITRNSIFTKTSNSIDSLSGINSYLWSQTSGTGTISFGTSNSSTTTILPDTDGSYIVRFTVTDNAGNSSYNDFNLTYDTHPPIISNILPVSGSRVSYVNQPITFNLNEEGDCRLSTTKKSYDGMSSDTSCITINSTNINCTSPNLGGSGDKNIYLACKDINGNKDTLDSVNHVIYKVKSGNTEYTDDTNTANYNFLFNINNGEYSTKDKNIKLNFSGLNNNFTSIDISSDPNFSNTISIPNQSEYIIDLCQFVGSCNSGEYTLYARPVDFSGGLYPAISDSIKYESISITDNISQTINEIIDQTKDVIDNIFNNGDQNNNNFISTTTPKSMDNNWNITEPAKINSLPSDVTLKLPDILSIFPTLKIDNIENKKVSLPNLSNLFGLTKNIELSKLSINEKKKIPSNIIFARISDEKLDLNNQLAVNNGVVTQKINVTQGKNVTFVVKPDKKANSVKGYLIFKSDNFSNRILNTASVINASVVSEDTDLVVNKFDYKDSGNGVWTGEVISPSVLGQYELKTVINYGKNDLEELNMIVVVDPEGYVYRKVGDEEVRLKNIEVSIYWLNPDTNKYELWEANKYKQKNPQITDITGRYSFLVPIGKYYLEAKSDLYHTYKSDVINVEENKGVFINIEMKKKFVFSDLFNINIGLISIILCLLALITFITYRNKKIKI